VCGIALEACFRMRGRAQSIHGTDRRWHAAILASARSIFRFCCDPGFEIGISVYVSLLEAIKLRL